MKITDNATYLRVALHTLQSKIAPELTSGDGQVAAAMVGQVLDELLKREIAAPALLAQQIIAGAPLATRLAAFATTHGITVPEPGDFVSDGAGFTALAAQPHRSRHWPMRWPTAARTRRRQRRMSCPRCCSMSHCGTSTIRSHSATCRYPLAFRLLFLQVRRFRVICLKLSCAASIPMART